MVPPNTSYDPGLGGEFVLRDPKAMTALPFVLPAKLSNPREYVI